MSMQWRCPQGHSWTPADGPGLARACPTCAAPPTLESLGAPPNVANAIQKLRDELTRLAGANLAGVVLYGGLARGRFRPGRSDVNLVVLLNDASAKSLSAIGPALQAAWRAARVEPLVLTPAEVKSAADAFASKFLDIQSFHVVLAGDDPFVGLVIDAEHLWLRVEQALRNLSLRLRRRYLAVADSPDELTATLARIARPFALELETLLRLKGRTLPADDRSAAVFDVAADAFQLDRAALARLAGLRQEMKLSTEEVADLYPRILDAVTRTAHIADQREKLL